MINNTTAAAFIVGMAAGYGIAVLCALLDRRRVANHHKNE